MENKRTELSTVGEFGLIEQLTKDIELKNKNSLYGIGDDAAVIYSNSEESILISTDLLIEGVHFNLMYTPLKHLGYKAVVANISDIYAMNGVAEQITVSIAVSNRFPSEAIEELYEGIKKACTIYHVDLVGGDTTSSLTGLMVSITAIGRANNEAIVYRKGANENDLIVVTGDLGAAYLGLQILEREKEVYKANPAIQPDLEGYDYLLERQLKPEARKDIIGFLKELNVKPTAMIDISDGLASEILHLCKNSELGCNIYNDKVPIDTKVSTTAIDFNLDPITCALNGGEDYELLFTIKQGDYEKIKGNPHMTVIGHMTQKNAGSYLIDKQGSAFPIKAQGWNHFNGSTEK